MQTITKVESVREMDAVSEVKEIINAIHRVHQQKQEWVIRQSIYLRS